MAYFDLARSLEREGIAFGKRELENVYTIGERYQEGAMESEKKCTPSWRQEIQIDHKFHGNPNKLLKTDWRIGNNMERPARANPFRPRSDSVDARTENPVHVALYQTEPNAGDFENS